MLSEVKMPVMDGYQLAVGSIALKPRSGNLVLQTLHATSPLTDGPQFRPTAPV